MTIETQKKLRYIPVVNVIVTTYFYDRACYRTNAGRGFRKSATMALVIIAIMALSAGLRMLINNDTVKSIIFWFTNLFVWSGMMIKAQEELEGWLERKPNRKSSVFESVAPAWICTAQTSTQTPSAAIRL